MPGSESELLAGLNDVSDADIANLEKELNIQENVDSKVEINKEIEIKDEAYEKTEEEISLEKLVFGDKKGLIQNLEKQAKKRSKQNEDKVKAKRKPAWRDSDDEDDLQVGDVVVETKYSGSLKHLNKEKSYKSHLTRKFERIAPTPKWADLDRKEEVDSDEEILKTVGHLAPVDSTNLGSGYLSCKKLKDLNRATNSEGPISDIQFHPASTVALVSGEREIATVYSIDGVENEKIHSMRFKNCPIKCTRLLSNGREVIFGSIRKFFYIYDLEESKATRIFLPKVMTTMKLFEISPDNNYIAVAGRFGEIHLLDMITKELIHTFKQEEMCTALKFSNDSKKILAHSFTSDVTIFDIGQQRAEHIFTDDGCLSGKCLAISPNSSLLATGSKEGIVNIYNYSDVFSSSIPVPQKIISNLRTSITDLKFNHNGEMLGLCSEETENAIKLVQFPTATVFHNFPIFNTKFGNVKRIQFSPNSGFLALGNSKGQVPLLRLKHFKNY